MPDRILEVHERTIVEERWRYREVAKRRRPELVPIHLSAGDLLQTKVFVMPRTIKDHVSKTSPEQGCYLGDGDHMLFEIAEHLIGTAGHRMAGHTSGLAEEDKGASLLGDGHCLAMPTGELINGSVSKHQSELEFRNRLSHHEEIDGCALRNLWEHPCKKSSVRVDGQIQQFECFLTDGLVSKAGTVR